MIKEGKILEQLKHPNIIGYREVYKTKRGKLCIVMDLAAGGDLASKIKQMKLEKKRFDESQVVNWFSMLVIALKHIHERKIIH